MFDNLKTTVMGVLLVSIFLLVIVICFLKLALNSCKLQNQNCRATLLQVSQSVQAFKQEAITNQKIQDTKDTQKIKLMTQANSQMKKELAKKIPAGCDAAINYMIDSATEIKSQ